MMNTNIRSKLPVKERNLKSALVNYRISNEIIENQNKQKFFCNRPAKATSDVYKEGDDILI